MIQVMRASGHWRCRARTVGTRLQTSPRAESLSTPMCRGCAGRGCFMGLATYRAGKVFILYDAARLCDAAAEVPPGPQLVDPGHWRSQGRVTGEARSEEHTSELQSRPHLVCRLLLE